MMSSTDMGCPYKILQVDCTADADEIKSAYRKLALEWHPDKNLGRVEESTKTFTLIQRAYELLCDPRERALYDKYRINIYYQDSNADESLDLFQYFLPNCYEGFDDGERGFYTVFCHVFETVASEEYPFANDPAIIYHSFGNSKSDYHEVVAPFYSFWLCFSSKRPFSWLNRYDIREAPNRAIAKLMEKENKKLRDQGRKKRSEKIRELVTLVRKRDKRVESNTEAMKAKEIARRMKEEETRKQMISDRLSKISSYKESDGIRESYMESLREIEEDLDAEFEESFTDKDGLENGEMNNDEYFCIVCQKLYRSQKAKINHLKSKKHREEVAILKLHLQMEDMNLLNVHMEVSDGVAHCSVDNPKSSKRSKRRSRKQFESAVNDESIARSKSSDPDDMKHPTGTFNEPSPSKIESGYSEKSNDSQENSGKRKLESDSSFNKASKGRESCGPKTGMCESCGELFDSRSKLFKHLKESGHASLKNAECEQNKKRTTKKNRNNGKLKDR